MAAVTPANDAYNQLYQECQSGILRYLARRTMRSYDDPDVEDLAGDVWLKVWEKWDTWTDRGIPRRYWVYQIAHNLLVDWVRHRRRTPSRSIEGVDAIMPLQDNWHTVDARLDVLEAWQSVSPAYRDFLLMNVAGYSMDETGSRLGVTQSTVKMRTFRGRDQLRDALRPHQGDGGAAMPEVSTGLRK